MGTQISKAYKVGQRKYTVEMKEWAEKPNILNKKENLKENIYLSSSS